MATLPAPGSSSEWSRFRRGLATQSQVVGALLMRELHTRYGRDNIGYLWMIGEPLTLASAIALLHSGEASHYGGDMRPLPFAVLGYCIFIMFRGIFNRAEGALESNMPLMYHKMVTIFDIMLSRALLEGAGTFLCFAILMTLLTSLGLAEPVERPLYLMAGIGFMFWFSFAISLVTVSITHDNRLLGRLVHPVSYIMMPLSGAFYRMEWIPDPYRTWLYYFPLTHIFELSRYGYFRSASFAYFSILFLTGTCMVLSVIGLLLIRTLRGRLHLS